MAGVRPSRPSSCYSPLVRRPAGEPRNRICRRFRLTPPVPSPAPSVKKAGVGKSGGRHGARRGPPRRVAGSRMDCSQCVPTAGSARHLSGVLPFRFREAQGPWRIDRHPIRPVLKHGPRSLTCARVIGLYETQRRNESEGRSRSVRGRIRAPSGFKPRARRGALPARLNRHVGEAEQERTRWDPKDGELCLSRTKSGETLMEVRSDSDVQIDRRTWV